MVDKKQLSIQQLKSLIAKERARLAKVQQRERLQTELRELQVGQRTGVRLVRRLGRGLKITGKKVGGALARQAKRIAEQQERQRIAESKIRRRTKLPKRRKARRPRDEGGLGIMAPLDF